MSVSYRYNEKTKIIHIMYGFGKNSSAYCGTTTSGLKSYESLKQIMTASNGNAVMCKNCQKKKAAIEAEKKRQENTIRFCRNCGYITMGLNATRCARCNAAELVLTDYTAKEWAALSEEEQLRAKEALVPDITKTEQAFQEKYQAEEAKREKEKQKAERYDEPTMHNIGVIMLLSSILLIVAACTMPGGSGAGTIGVIGCVMTVIGFLLAVNNRSASKIRDDQEMARLVVSGWGAKVKAGKTITDGDIDKAISDMGMDGIQKHKERKRIITGAITGGIVAGDIGAVAGAVAAKAKIEEEKLNR